MPERRPPGATAMLERLIGQIAAAINTRALYHTNHPRVLQAIESVLGALAAACQARGQDAVTFLIVGDDVVVDERPLRRGPHQQNFVQALKRRGAERLTLARGADAAELEQLLGAAAAGKAPVSTPHVIVGKIEIAALDGEKRPSEPGPEAPGGPGAGPRRAEAVSAKQLDDAREAFGRFRKDQAGSLRPMEEVVWGMMEVLSGTTRAVLPIAALKDHDEYTFIHSVNVSLLVLAQGASLGLQGPMLHAVGLAALLHDVGKLSVPLSVLNKPGRLEDEEWKVMMSHAELGAWHLSRLDTSAPLSILVAYEHHLRYDGLPAYPLLNKPRRPSLASLMTGLADTYDAIRTVRPYQKAQSAAAALEIIQRRSGTFHDPFLAGNFHRLVQSEAAPAGPGAA